MINRRPLRSSHEERAYDCYDFVRRICGMLSSDPVTDDWWIKPQYGQDVDYITAEHRDYSVRVVFQFYVSGWCYVDAYFTNGAFYDRRTVHSWDWERKSLEENLDEVALVLDTFFDNYIDKLRD